ncbi:MAG: Mur ligase domain-containing protein [Holosporales bacterium]|jgi:UDP-N-acetylmuramoyl-tripeptide--D-alanyl-D-alanine ligase|nr:Mur ligase domain-containing protein [Holosporales bacterium]
MTPEARKKKKLVVGGIELETSGLSIDSRSIRPGEVFFALRGSTGDGHRFVSESLDKGAVAAFIDNPEYHDPPKTILVDNVLESLKEAGLFLKNLANPGKMIGITGSVGKTTTKLWLSEILNHHHKTFTTMNNYNTIYGLPIALSNIDDNLEYFILEMGTSHPGEISELSNYLSPDIGIITNIFESHIGNFKDKAELADEKISIIDGMRRGGILIFDGDSEYAEKIKMAASAKKIQTISVGFSVGCDVMVRMESSPRHHSYIKGCIEAVLMALDLDIEKFLPYFDGLKPLKGRGEIIDCRYNGKLFTLIDESYNASPTAMMAAIENLDHNYRKPKKVAIIGQMKDLGDHEEYYHRIVAERLSRCTLDGYFFIGDEELWKIFAGATTCYAFLDPNRIEEILSKIPDGAVVLLKGSHTIRLDGIINQSCLF